MLLIVLVEKCIQCDISYSFILYIQGGRVLQGGDWNLLHVEA